MRYAHLTLFCCFALALSAPAARTAEIEIGSSINTARAHFQAEKSEIGIDHDEGDWHILVVKQSDHITNLLFEKDRLRYISYNFYLGAYSSEPGSVTRCNEAFARQIALIATTYGEGLSKTTMAWPEREIAVTWAGPHHYALARELSDLNGCLLVKAMIFDGTEEEFKRFDKRLTAQ